MERYIIKIVQTLEMLGVSCWYNNEEDMIHILNKSSIGNTFGVYGYINGTIRNCCIYDQVVAEEKIEPLQEYLSKINKDIEAGYLFVNKSIGYVVFYIDYPIHDSMQSKDEENFIFFCRQSHDIFCRYRENLYDIIKN